MKSDQSERSNVGLFERRTLTGGFADGGEAHDETHRGTDGEDDLVLVARVMGGVEEKHEHDGAGDDGDKHPVEEVQSCCGGGDGDFKFNGSDGGCRHNGSDGGCRHSGSDGGCRHSGGDGGCRHNGSDDGCRHSGGDGGCRHSGGGSGGHGMVVDRRMLIVVDMVWWWTEGC